MIPLSSKRNVVVGGLLHKKAFIAKVTTNADLPEPLRKNLILRLPKATGPQPDYFRLILVDDPGEAASNGWINVIHLDEHLRYLGDGDIVRFSPDYLDVQALYRRNANINSFLLTERCNSFCLMCSQPPRDIDDSYRAEEILEALPMIDRGTPEIMFSGGEPTLLGGKFFELVRSAKTHLPDTALHILSNGRNFKNESLAQSLAEIGHRDLMLGIPIYSDVPWQHDFIVQADGAFDETIRGILNLKRYGVRVEVRVVVHRQNYERLPKLAEFLGRNLLFLDQVALMGLEHTGFTKANMDALWIDPYDYREEMNSALRTLERFGMRALVFNHQLCTLDEYSRAFAVKSISDWKNDYLPECKSCSVSKDCGGFFSSTMMRHSAYIRPILAVPA